ncbi:MAG: hypothetical protein KAJ19_25500, partial [Gammaproteobacteria bacterium]|nr:hypothetical protein [Gammaproteobacteria bacterium]
ESRRRANARSYARVYLARGKLIRPDFCSCCGNGGDGSRIEMHHQNYSKPLEITWLCRVCHGAEHGRRVTERE